MTGEACAYCRGDQVEVLSRCSALSVLFVSLTFLSRSVSPVTGLPALLAWPEGTKTQTGRAGTVVSELRLGELEQLCLDSDGETWNSLCLNSDWEIWNSCVAVHSESWNSL